MTTSALVRTVTTLPRRVLPHTLALAAAACSGSGSSAPPPPTLTIAKAATASGDGQTDSVLTTLPNPLRVSVTLGGTPHAGDAVNWATTGSGSSVTPLQSLTDANGVATTTWKLGQVAGAQSATATLSSATGSPVSFAATATPGAATQLIQPTGDGQAWMVGTVLPQPLGVTTADQYGNGVSGIAVGWLVTSGSANVSPMSAVSSASGSAQTTVTLGGTAGPITITATHAGLTGSPRTFNATAQPIPTTASVTVGAAILFKSDGNLSSNPAVDTIAVGGTVTWSWAGGSHSVQSTGSPSFTSSGIMMSGNYSHTFTTAGVYRYDCAVHSSLMTGTIVVR